MITTESGIEVTPYGMAVSRSFIKPGDAEYIRSNLQGNPLDVALEMEPFTSAYLSGRLHRKLSQAVKAKFSTRLMADSTLDILSGGITLLNWIADSRRLF